VETVGKEEGNWFVKERYDRRGGRGRREKEKRGEKM